MLRFLQVQTQFGWRIVVESLSASRLMSYNPEEFLQRSAMVTSFTFRKTDERLIRSTQAGFIVATCLQQSEHPFQGNWRGLRPAYFLRMRNGGVISWIAPVTSGLCF